MAQERKGQAGPVTAEIEEHLPEKLHPVLEYFVNHLKPIVAAVAVIVLVVGAVSGFKYYQESRHSESVDDLGSILVSESGEQQVKDLQQFAADAPEGLEVSALLALADAAVKNKDHQAAADAFAKLRDINDVTIRALAAMGQANALLELDRGKEAVEVLLQADKTAPEAFHLIILRQLAEAAETAGENQVAIDAYKEMIAQAGDADTSFVDERIDALQKGLDQNASQDQS